MKASWPRRLRNAALIGMLLSSCSWASAEPYPSKPIRLIVPFPAGGITDVAARVLAEHMGSVLGQPMVVDNRPGASSSIGMEAAARATPDGYTLILASTTGLVLNPLLMPVKFDPLRDFEPIGLANDMTALLLAHPDFPAKTYAEFIDYAKKQPEGINYANWGPASPGEICMRMISSTTGISINAIQYKGGSPIVADLMAGHVQVGVADVGSALGAVKSGKLRILASCAGRSTVFPDAPTYKELGVDYDVLWRTMLMAPAAVPAEIRQRMHEAFVRAMARPAAVAKLQGIGATPPPKALSPVELRQVIQRDLDAFKKVIQAAQIKPVSP